MNPPPLVSVVVPTYRDGSALATCLEALARQTFPLERFEVLVVDNDTRPTAHITAGASAAANVRWLHESAPGSYAARNRALAEVRGKLVAFTDADCVPEPTWIEAGVDAFAEDPSVARLAGHVELIEQGRAGPATLHERVFGFRQDRLALRGTAVTANMWARREVFDVVGTFNAGLRSGGDVVWGWAAEAAGFSVRYAPTVRVMHPNRSTLAALAAKAQRVYGGEFARRFPPGTPRALLLVRGFGLLKPPLRRMRDAHSEARVHGVALLLVAVVEMRLRVAQFVEHVRLSLGGTPHR